MERLTGKDELGYYAPRNITLNCLKQRGELVDRLAYYEDLEEQGRLVVLPCKVGDHVWINGILGLGEAEEHIVTKVNRYDDENGVRLYFYADLVGTDGQSWVRFFDDQIGKTVFLTREEAEVALGRKDT